MCFIYVGMQNKQLFSARIPVSWSSKLQIFKKWILHISDQTYGFENWKKNYIWLKHTLQIIWNRKNVNRSVRKGKNAKNTSLHLDVSEIVSSVVIIAS